MDQFNKKIEGIRRMMEEMKSDKYAISIPELVELDEYIKSLYLKVLCTIIQYENNPTDVQVLYLKRIIKGMHAEQSMEEYMRKALDISEADIQEFLKNLEENKIKYYFVLDGIILASIGNGDSVGYEYLAELIELLGVNKEDLQYISLVAKSVLMQESKLYNSAKALCNERVEMVNYAPYILNYYCGAIVDTNEEKYYSAPEKRDSVEINYPNSYRERKVTFSNLVLEITHDWNFEGCEEVIFKNCVIIGGEYSLFFLSCKHVIFFECQIKDFSSYAILMKLIDKIEFQYCKFENCIYKYSRGYDDWSMLGGVIHVDQDDPINSNRIIYGTDSTQTARTYISDSTFKNCGGRNDRNYYSSAIISNDYSKVKNCKFINCWNYSGGTEIDPENSRRTLFAPGCVQQDNEIVASAKIC